MDNENRIDPSSRGLAFLSEARGSPPAHPHQWAPTHDVQFYASEDALTASVARFLVQGVRAGQPIIVVATPSHRAAFESAMRSMGIDPSDLVEGRDAIWLDARSTLSAFMEGSRVNLERFATAVDNVFDRLMRDRRYVIVRAYGEMVDLLCHDGELEAALVLEDLWNELATKYSFSLLCSYAAENVIQGDSANIDRISEKHTRVLTSDGKNAA